MQERRRKQNKESEVLHKGHERLIPVWLTPLNVRTPEIVLFFPERPENYIDHSDNCLVSQLISFKSTAQRQPFPGAQKLVS